MNTRRIELDIKLGGKGLVHVVSQDTRDANDYYDAMQSFQKNQSKSMKQLQYVVSMQNERLPLAVIPISDVASTEGYFVRAWPDVYNSFLPGEKKPVCTFIPDQDTAHFKNLHQIKFVEEADAKAYLVRLRAMNIWVYKDPKNQPIEKSKQDGSYIIRTDRFGIDKINFAGKYFSNLFPYQKVEQIETRCANALLEFQQSIWDPFVASVKSKESATRDLFAPIFDAKKMSNSSHRKRMEKLIKLIDDNSPNPKEQSESNQKVDLLSSISSAVSSVVASFKKHSPEAILFYKNAGEFSLQTKLSSILDAAASIKNPLLEAAEKEIAAEALTLSQTTTTTTTIATDTKPDESSEEGFMISKPTVYEDDENENIGEKKGKEKEKEKAGLLEAKPNGDEEDKEEKSGKKEKLLLSQGGHGMYLPGIPPRVSKPTDETATPTHVPSPPGF